MARQPTQAEILQAEQNNRREQRNRTGQDAKAAQLKAYRDAIKELSAHPAGKRYIAQLPNRIGSDSSDADLQNAVALSQRYLGDFRKATGQLAAQQPAASNGAQPDASPLGALAGAQQGAIQPPQETAKLPFGMGSVPVSTAASGGMAGATAAPVALPSRNTAAATPAVAAANPRAAAIRQQLVNEGRITQAGAVVPVPKQAPTPQDPHGMDYLNRLQGEFAKQTTNEIAGKASGAGYIPQGGDAFAKLKAEQAPAPVAPESYARTAGGGMKVASQYGTGSSRPDTGPMMAGAGIQDGKKFIASKPTTPQQAAQVAGANTADPNSIASQAKNTTNATAPTTSTSPVGTKGTGMPETPQSPLRDAFAALAPSAVSGTPQTPSTVNTFADTLNAQTAQTEATDSEAEKKKRDLAVAAAAASSKLAAARTRSAPVPTTAATMYNW